jgi:hypothetical protein
MVLCQSTISHITERDTIVLGIVQQFLRAWKVLLSLPVDIICALDPTVSGAFRSLCCT